MGSARLAHACLPAGSQANAVRQLLAHRLSSASGAAAKREWYEIVEGEHALWQVGRGACDGLWLALMGSCV